MDAIATPPAIPVRTRQHFRRSSLQGPPSHSRNSDANRVQIQPASPEVISSLITSLSIISSPANDLFERSDGISSFLAPSSTAHTSSSAIDRHMHSNGGRKSGSFGIDYGAYKQPSREDVQEQGSLDELAASPPVIRTAKPPSGFSPLTAPKSPAKDGGIKTLLRGSSRPSSKGSNGSKDRDDVISIGSLSIEPGIAPGPELRRMSSGESWGKKQGRNSKSLMYMSSKERLRDSERKRASMGAVGGTRSRSQDRLPPPKFDATSFMAERPISEEMNADQVEHPPFPGTTLPATASPNLGGVSPALSSGSFQAGGMPGRPIPARDSSLRKATPSKTKRASQRSSRQSGHFREEAPDETIKEVDEQPESRRERSTEKSGRDRLHIPADSTSKLHQPLRNPPTPEHLKVSGHASKHSAESAKVEQRLLADDKDEGAPSPAIAQRKSRTSSDYLDGFSTKNKKSGRQTPDPLVSKQSKRDSKMKRLSAPLSPTTNLKESHHRSASQPLSQKEMTSPEPIKPSQTKDDDRPTSADSIDDAVDSYLCSPRLSQKIGHPQTGRIISFSEVGDPEGYAVFCCVGMGLTRYITAFYDELALTLKLRLITPDRPGVGDSESYTDGTATPLSWPDDVYAICQALKITKFSILAHSAGAIYALATALRMPQHIRGRIHLLAPWIPPSQLNVAGAQQSTPPSNSIPTSQRILRALPTPILKAANSSFMSATSTSITSSLPKSPRRTKRKAPNGRETPLSGRSTVTPGPDKENLGPNSAIYPKPTNLSVIERAANNPSDPNSQAAILAAAANTLAEKERQTTYDTRLTHAIWELATLGANPAVDLLVCLERRHTIGFRYVDITRAVVIHHGSKDTRVPVENVKWLGKMMRRCEVRILEGEGHGLMASAGVMGGILMEIAREWEDWNTVVQQKPIEPGVRGRTLRERASIGAFR